MKFCSVLLGCCFSVCLLQTTNSQTLPHQTLFRSVSKLQNSPSAARSGMTNGTSLFRAGDLIVQHNSPANSGHISGPTTAATATESAPKTPLSSSSSASSSSFNSLSEEYPLPWILGVRGESVDYETFGILFSDEPITGLTRRCMLNIPVKHRKNCLGEAYGAYAESRYALKTQCCSKWAQLDCLERYTYNAIYCSILEQITIRRFFSKLRSLDSAPECSQYRPIQEEQKKWSSTLGRVASCSVPVKAEITNRFPDRPL